MKTKSKFLIYRTLIYCLFFSGQTISQNWRDRSVFLTENTRGDGEITGTNYRVEKRRKKIKKKMQNLNLAGKKTRLSKKTRTLTQNKTNVSHSRNKNSCLLRCCVTVVSLRNVLRDFKKIGPLLVADV